MNAYELAPYTGSKDYARLAELAKAQSIVCFVEHDGRREVARTSFQERRSGDFWSVAGNGVGYVTAFSREDFMLLCEHRKVEFLEPPSAASE